MKKHHKGLIDSVLPTTTPPTPPPPPPETRAIYLCIRAMLIHDAVWQFNGGGGRVDGQNRIDRKGHKKKGQHPASPTSSNKETAKQQQMSTDEEKEQGEKTKESTHLTAFSCY